MRRISFVGSVAAALLCSGSWIAASSQNSGTPPSSQSHPVMAARIYTGPDGESHFDQASITLQGAPVETSAALKMSDASIVRAAPGTFEPWHNADRKRYVVVISGEAEVANTSGEKIRIVPGQIYIAEDLTGRGHTFRVVGNEA